MSMFDAPLPGWAIVEHGGQRLAGWVEEQEIARTAFISVTRPGGHPVILNASLVDAIRPCDEATVRETA